MPADNSKFWDLGEYFSSPAITDHYTDWEGMSGSDEMEREIKTIDEMGGSMGLSEMGKDLLLHLAYESRDQAEPATDEQLAEWGAALTVLMGCRYFMRSGVAWKS